MNKLGLRALPEDFPGFDPIDYGYWFIDYCVLHEGQLICPRKPARPITTDTKPSVSKRCYHCGRVMSVYHKSSHRDGKHYETMAKYRDPWPVCGREAGGTEDDVGFCVLCEECWDALTPTERLAYHLAEAKRANWFLEIERIKEAVLGE